MSNTESNTDKRIPLTECNITTLRLGDLEFTLDSKKPVGRGGTCLVYHAMQKDDDGIGRKVILKEFYPECDGCGDWRDRQTGSLTIPPEEESIEDRRKRFFDSYEQFKALFNEEELNMYVVQAHRLPHGNGTDYMVVDYSSGMTLQDYLKEEHGLFDFFTRMRVLALLMEEIHKRGLVHMDLKPENLLCFENHDVVKLLDTDSFVEKAIFAGKDAVEIILSGSPGYTAPEIRKLAEGLAEDWIGCYFLRQNFAELGHRADLYSFGVMLSQYLWKDQPSEAQLADCLRQREPYRSEKAMRLIGELLSRTLAYLRQREPYLSEKAMRLIGELLSRTRAYSPEDRFETMAQLAGKIETLLPLLDPKKPQLAEQFSENPFPVLGREKALALLEEFFRSQTGRWGRIVCISGIGGVGKSALARLFAQRHAGEYDVITEVSAASAEDAVAAIRILPWEADESLSNEGRPDISKKKKMLIQLCREQKVLLLVHDYDGTDDASFKIWEELGCDVILTSRSDWSGRVSMVRLTCADLGEEGAKAVFRQYYLQSCETEERRLSALLESEAAALTQLLQQVDYHPMTLQLLARYMTYVPGGELGPAEALKVLTSGIFEAASPREFQSGQEAVDYNNVYGHLSKLFRWSMDSKRFRPQEVETLRNMLLIPSGLGICASRFQTMTGLGGEWLERLKRSGWLEYLPRQQDVLALEAPAGVYILPNVLQQVLIQEPELSVRMDQLEAYGDRLYQRFRRERHYMQRQAIMVHMEQLLMLREEPTEEYLFLLLQLSLIYGILCKLEKMKELAVRFLRLYEQVPPVIRENPTFQEVSGQMRKLNAQLHGTWEGPKELSAMDELGLESLSDVLDKIGEQFTFGNANKAIAMAMKVNVQGWNRMDLQEQVRFLFLLIQMQSAMGMSTAAEKNYKSLSILYRGEADWSRKAILDPHFFGASYEFAAMRLLLLDFTEETRTWLTLLRDLAREKLGRENIFTGRLEALLARYYEHLGDFAEAAACRERAAETEQIFTEKMLREKAENLMHLSLDYGQREPEKAGDYCQKALTLYNSFLRKCPDDRQIATPEELQRYYVTGAALLVRDSKVPGGLEMLENWLWLACRLLQSDSDIAAWFAVVAVIYDNFGLKEKAAAFRRHAKLWAPSLVAFNRLRPNSRWLKNWIKTNIGEDYDLLLELAEEHRFR